MLTETVQLALITFLSLAVTAYFNYLTVRKQAAKLGEEIKAVHVDVIEKVAIVKTEVTSKVDHARNEIEVVRSDVNSKVAEMIKLKGEAEHAKGKIEGQSEEKAKSMERDKGRQEAKQEIDSGKI